MSQKGGAGKSTLSRALAVAALLDGRRSLIIDTDPQATVSTWSRSRPHPAPTIETSTNATALPAILKQYADSADVAIIDTPPHAGVAVSMVATAVDAILIPVRPSPDDLSAVRATVEVAQLAGRPAALVINASRSKRSIQATRHALAVFGLPVCPTVLADRLAHQDAAAYGLTAQEHEPNGEAAAEVAAMWKWVRDAVMP